MSRYKGFRITPRSYQLRESGRWTVDLEIRRQGRQLPFSLTEHCATEEEANARCSALGRRIIDGGLPGWSVDRLRGGRRDSTNTVRRCVAAVFRPLVLAGLLLIGVGVFLCLREPRVTLQSGELSLSEASAAAHARQSLWRWGGGAAVIGGIALIAAGGRRRP